MAAWARKYPEIVEVFLFGSRARGTSHSKSDVDLAVVVSDFEGETAYTRYLFGKHDWKAELVSALGCPVSLVRRVSDGRKVIQDSIENDEILLYQKNAA